MHAYDTMTNLLINVHVNYCSKRKLRLQRVSYFTIKAEKHAKQYRRSPRETPVKAERSNKLTRGNHISALHNVPMSLLTGFVVSEVCPQRLNQVDRPTVIGVQASEKGDLQASNGQRIVSRDLDFNAANRSDKYRRRFLCSFFQVLC